jgi:hypothetical protein
VLLQAVPEAHAPTIDGVAAPINVGDFPDCRDDRWRAAVERQRDGTNPDTWSIP